MTGTVLKYYFSCEITKEEGSAGMAEILGFIGVGNMGEPIAQNLMRAGYSLQVYKSL